MSARLKILISGPGLIGKAHARLIHARKDCELVAIVAPATEDHAAFASQFGATLFEDIETALSSQNIDAAIISSPNKFHFDQATACIQRGVPVLVEKPFTEEVKTARQLSKLAERTGVQVLVGHHRTYSPLLEVARRFIASPSFGTPVALQGSALFYKPQHYFDEGTWRTKLGGGPILINMIHEIGLMRFFFGEISSVSATSSNKLRGFEVEDTVALTLKFENGALGTFMLSDVAASNWSWEMTSGENPSYPFFPEGICYHFAGTNGSLDFPNMMARSYEKDSTRSWWRPFQTTQLDVMRADPLESQIAHFVDVIRGTVAPRVSHRDGFRNMQVIEAIQRSIVTGSSVEIEHFEN